MSSENETEPILLPHHEQQPICTNRLPYRQGRKLTAIKVYTVNNESKHLLIFGVPSLNLRQETKSLFLRFGRLIQFSISKEHATEQFTETYHAAYERIQSARVAKKMLDAKNFYGGSLHICYAPEFESIDETRQKLLQRQKDVTYRLHNLQKEELLQKKVPNITTEEKSEENIVSAKKFNMGEINTIDLGNKINPSCSKKRKHTTKAVIVKKFKPCFIEKSPNMSETEKINDVANNVTNKVNDDQEEPVDVIDCTSIDVETITNINECLNYKSFGTEDVRKVPEKRVNRIQFNIKK